jgi:site-specific recombinase XerD
MSVAFQLRTEDNQPSRTAFIPFPTTPRVPDNDLIALITDFFDWLERDWQLPVYTMEAERLPLPLPLALTKELVTVNDLTCFSGYTRTHVRKLLRNSGVFPVRPDNKGNNQVYRYQDIAPLIEQWNWKRLIQTLDIWWQYFFSPACETCKHCQIHTRHPFSRQMYCASNAQLILLRSVFAHFLGEVHRLGSVTAWWHDYQVGTWSRDTSSAWGIVFIYLLDRQLLHLSHDELFQLEPIRHKGVSGITRLWRNRRPEEYQQFLQAMKATNYKDGLMPEEALLVIGLFALLKYGLPGVAELGRPLSSEEILQVCSERRLVTTHLGSGIFLPYPLTTDIRVGHVILDDIRYFIWQYAADQERKQGNNLWYKGPSNWEQMTISITEQALAAPMYEQAKGILSRRPETEGRLINPWRIFYKGKLADAGYALLPSAVQEHLMTYFTYCHQEKRMELASLFGSATNLSHFFTWVRTQGKLVNYPHWTRQYAQEVFRSYASLACAGLKASTRHKRLMHIAHFFSTLADLEYPVPAGYHLLYNLEKNDKWHPRDVPNEKVMDRVFRDGVCNLTYDVFSRLALTIQYYCGTRVTETIQLHLICVLEDQRGHAFLLIPKGKSKQERPFPIVEPGMELLDRYMDEIMKLRLSEDGTTLRTLGKTNIRYQDDDPERAKDWQYLFERVSSPDGSVKRSGRLSSVRVGVAMKEALLIAAKINPDGLFQQETYSPTCHHQRRKGLKCWYFAAQEGITVCPYCRSPLSGQRGARCYQILEEDFKCDGIARNGEVFCPKCDTPLAKFLSITTHVFRHNSVSRADRAGVSLAHNMKLHGHETIPMHLRYLHRYLEDTTDEVKSVFAEKRLREVRQALRSAPGQIVEGGIAYTVSLEHYLGLTLQRALKRRTYGIWGGFWAGALAQRGVASPLSLEDEIVIPEDTYEHTVAQYWYEALGLAVSEVAFERVTQGKWRAEVPPFLDRQKIEGLVQLHLRVVQDSLGTALGMRLMETDIIEQRRFLDDLAEKLRPWWKHLGTIDPLVEMFMPMPGGGSAFHKQLPPAEPAP